MHRHRPARESPSGETISCYSDAEMVSQSGVADVLGITECAVDLAAADQPVSVRKAVERVDAVRAGLAVQDVVTGVATDHVVAAGAVDDVGVPVTGEDVVSAAGAQALEVAPDVVALAGLTVDSAVTDRRR